MPPTTATSFSTSTFHPTPPSSPSATITVKEDNGVPDMSSSNMLSSHPLHHLSRSKKKKRPSLMLAHSNLDPLLGTASTLFRSSQHFGDVSPGVYMLGSEGLASPHSSPTSITPAVERTDKEEEQQQQQVLEEESWIQAFMEGTEYYDQDIPTPPTLSLRKGSKNSNKSNTNSKKKIKKKATVAAADLFYVPTPPEGDPAREQNVTRRRRGLHTKSASFPSTLSPPARDSDEFDPLLLSSLLSVVDLNKPFDLRTEKRRRRRRRAVSEGVSLDIKQLRRLLELDGLVNDSDLAGLDGSSFFGVDTSYPLDIYRYHDLDGDRSRGSGGLDDHDKQSAEVAVTSHSTTGAQQLASRPAHNGNNNDKKNTLARIYAARAHTFHAPLTVQRTQTQNNLPILLEDDAQEQQQQHKQKQYARGRPPRPHQRSRVTSVPATVADRHYTRSFLFSNALLHANPEDACAMPENLYALRRRYRLPLSLQDLFGLGEGDESLVSLTSTAPVAPFPFSGSSDWRQSPVEHQSSSAVSTPHFPSVKIQGNPDTNLPHESECGEESADNTSTKTEDPSVPQLPSPLLYATIPPPSPPLSPLLISCTPAAPLLSSTPLSSPLPEPAIVSDFTSSTTPPSVSTESSPTITPSTRTTSSQQREEPLPLVPLPHQPSSTFTKSGSEAQQQQSQQEPMVVGVRYYENCSGSVRSNAALTEHAALTITPQLPMHSGPTTHQQTTSTPCLYLPPDFDPPLGNICSTMDEEAAHDKEGEKGRETREGDGRNREGEGHEGVKGSSGIDGDGRNGYRSRSRSRSRSRGSSSSSSSSSSGISGSYIWSGQQEIKKLKETMTTMEEEEKEVEEERGSNSKLASNTKKTSSAPNTETKTRATIDNSPDVNINITPCTPDRKVRRGSYFLPGLEGQKVEQERKDHSRAIDLGKSVPVASVDAQGNATAALTALPVITATVATDVSTVFAVVTAVSTAHDHDDCQDVTVPCPSHLLVQQQQDHEQQQQQQPRSFCLLDHHPAAFPSPLSLERLDQQTSHSSLSSSHPDAVTSVLAQDGWALDGGSPILPPPSLAAAAGTAEICCCSSSSSSSSSFSPLSPSSSSFSSLPSFSLPLISSHPAKDPASSTALSLTTHVLDSSTPAPPTPPITVETLPLLPSSESSSPPSTPSPSPSLHPAIPMLKTDFPHEPLLSSPISINSSHHPLSQPTTTKNSSSSQYNYYHGLNLNKRRPSGGSLLGQDPTSRFEILERLGYGSTGSIVYKARDLQEDKIIAIKKIPIGLLAAFPGEETTSEDVDYFVSWIVDHCIADEPVADVGEDDDMLSHSSSNHALVQTPASPAIVPTSEEHDDNDVDVDSQQQPTVAADAKAAAGEGGGRPRSHSVGSTRSRSGSVGSLRQSSSSRRRVRTRPSRQLLEEERLGLERLVRCLGCHRTDTDLWLELEYCPAGSAADLIRLTGGALSENEIGWLMSQVLYAVAYLHARGHVHGDIKAANILLTLDGQVKLGGSGAIMNHKEGAGERKRRRRSLTMSEFPASWLAPETSATTTAAAASVPASPSTPSSPTAYQQQQQQQSSIPPSPGATLQRSSSFADTVSGGGGQQGSNDIGSAGWSAGGGSSGGMPEATIEADIWALGVACIELCQGMPPQPQAPILSIATAVAVAKCSGCNGDNSRDASSRTGTPVSDGSSDTMGEGESGGGKSTSSSSTSNGDGSPEGDRSYSIAMSASHPSMAISTSSPSFTSIYSPLMEDTGSSGFGGMTASFNSTTRADSANGLGDLTSRMSPTFWGFVARCLTPEPAARPTVHDLLHDPFIVERKHTKDELLERIQAMQAFVDQCAALTLAEPLLPEKPSNRDAATHGQTNGNKNTVDEGMSGWGGAHCDLHSDDMEEQDGPRDLSDTTAGVYSREETVMDSAHPHHGSIEALRDEDEIPHVFGVKKVQSNGDGDNDDDDDDFRDPFEQRIGPWRVNLMPSRVEGTYDASSYFDEAGLPIAPSNQRHDNPIEWKNQRISHPIVKQALMCERAGYFSFRHSRSPSLATIVETEEERALERERELERARERQRRELERARLKAAAAAVSVLSLNKATAATAMTPSATTMAMQSTTTTATSMPIIVNKDELVDVDEQARKEEDDEDRRRKNRAESVAAAVAVAAAAAASSGSDSGSMTGSDGGNGGGNNNSVAAAAAAAAAAAMAAPASKISTLSQATTSTALMPPNPIQRLRRQSQVERDDASRQAVKERMQMMQQQREREEQELQLREAHGVDVAKKANATSADPQQPWPSEMAPCKKGDVITTTAYTPSRSKQLHGVTRSTSRGSNMSGGGGVGRGFLRRPLSKVGDQGLVIQAAEGTGDATVGEDMHGKVERGLEPEDDSSPGKTKKKNKVKKKLKKLAKIFSLQWWKQLGRRRKSSHDIVGQTSDKRR